MFIRPAVRAIKFQDRNKFLKANLPGSTPPKPDEDEERDNKLDNVWNHGQAE